MDIGYFIFDLQNKLCFLLQKQKKIEMLSLFLNDMPQHVLSILYNLNFAWMLLQFHVYQIRPSADVNAQQRLRSYWNKQLEIFWNIMEINMLT